MEPIHLDDIVQSAQCHPSGGETAPLPSLREKGRKESLRERMREDCERPKVPTGRLLCAKPVLSGVYGAAEEGAAARGLWLTPCVER